MRVKRSTRFESLYEATSAKLFGVALRILKSEARAEEALQEAYLKIWRSADSYSLRRGRPMTWLINVVRNQALDLRRASKSRHEDKSEALDDTLVAANNPQGESEVSGELIRLQRCLERLSEDQRACFLMVYHEGYTPTEASQRQSWPIGTVKTWLRRGLMSIRECLAS